MMKIQTENIILGAGISGLVVGNILNHAGQKVIILEKTRGVGGRMATRRFGEGVFDHGAQFFTARDPQFHQWVRQWLKEGSVQAWSRGFSRSGEKTHDDGHLRFLGTTGMTAPAKKLADSLDIRLQTQVNSISQEGNLWYARTSKGEQFFGKNLILTAPVPQSLILLEAGGVSLPEDVYHQLKLIEYDPCIAVLVLLEGKSRIPSPGGIQFTHGPIRWVGDNAQKGISPKATAITIHASSMFSLQNFDEDNKLIAEKLIKALQPWLGEDISDYQVHKWRYSQPVNIHPERFLEVPGPPAIFFAGDAFGGPRVEGAALSGVAVGQYLTKRNC